MWIYSELRFIAVTWEKTVTEDAEWPRRRRGRCVVLVDSWTGTRSTAKRVKVIFIVPFSPWHLRCVLCPDLSHRLLVTKKAVSGWLTSDPFHGVTV